MISIQDAREQLAAKNKDVRALVLAVDQDQSAIDAGFAEIERIEARIANIEKMNTKAFEDNANDVVIDVLAKSATDKRSPVIAAFHNMLRVGKNAITAEDRALIMNTMSTTTNSEGGFTVATEVASEVVKLLKDFGGMRQVARQITTDLGNPLNYPTSDATAEKGRIVAENATVTRTDPSFGSVSLNVFKYSSDDVAVPIELLMDSAIDIQSLVIDILVSRIGRIQNDHFTTGTGSSQPRGAATGASTGITAANSTSQVTAILADTLFSVQHSLDPAYRANAVWMFNDATMLLIRRLKDSQNRYLFVPGYDSGVPGGVPATLLGSPIQVNQSMADMAASARSILYGDFSRYIIRDALDLTFYRFDDSAFTRNGQIGFLAFARSGGNLVDTSAVKAFINAAS
jgi:HK97 family phage major capsid protein